MRTLSTALALLLLSTTVTAAEVVKSVPDQFIGKWNASLDDCGTDRNDSAIEIKRNEILFHESDGPIKAMVTDGRHEIAMIVELSGEGQTWLTTAQFKLSAGEDKLISTQLPEKEFMRYRCPRKTT